MSLESLGSLFSGFDEIFNGTYKGFKSTSDMDTALQKAFAGQFKVGADGVSEFTMQQIQAKAAAMGLTEELTTQAVAMASDASLSAKAAAGKITWKDAVKDTSVDLDELTEALRKTGKISDSNLDFAKAATNLDQYRARLTSFIDETGEFADSLIDVGTSAATSSNKITDVFKGIGASITSFITTPIGALSTVAVAGTIATVVGLTKYYNQFSDAVEKASKSQSDYSGNASELTSLQSQLDTVNQRIEEIKSQGTINLTDEAELQRLQAQSAELERQIGLQKQLTDNAATKSAKDALDVLKLQRTGDLTQEYQQTVNPETGATMTNYKETDIITATRNELKELQSLKKQESELLNERQQTKSDKKRSALDDQIDDIQSEIQKYKDTLSNNVNTLNDLKNSFVDQTTGKVMDGYEQYFNDIVKLVDGFNNIDLSPTEQKLKAVQDFFEGDNPKNFIKDELLDIVKSGGGLNEITAALEKMGISLDDTGLDAETVTRYFQEMASSAQSASEAINSVDGSFEGVQAAFESANQGAEWDAMASNISQAMELLKEGRVGTDDFQTVAQWMSYNKVDENAYKYDADAYVDAWKKAYDQVSRWFDSENPLQSMWNFAEDLEGKGLATITKDANGSLAEIIPTFDNTAEAAKNFGVSVEAVETAMHKLEEYGFEFDNVTFSGENLDRYQKALTNIKDLYNSMDEGETKDRLKGMIENWDSEYAQYEQDMSQLTEDQVVHIEFEYDLATIQQQIDQLKSQAEAGGDSQTWAELISGQKSYREKSEEGLGLNTEGIQIPVEYTAAEDSIEKLQSQLVNVTGKDKIQVQAEISNLYDLQNDLLNAFDESGLSWDEFLKTDDAKSILNELSSDTEEAMQKVAEILGADPKDFKVKVDADTSDAENKLRGVLSANDDVITMKVDASTADIQQQIDSLKQGQTIVFTADVDGVKQGIEGVKNEDGTVTYYTNVDGVRTEITPVLNQDGTVSYTLGSSPDKVPDAKGNANFALGTHPNTAPSITGTANYSGHFPSKAPTLSGIINYTANIVKTVGGVIAAVTGKYNGSAHAHGTARKGKALVSGDWSVHKNEEALVGELGTETIVRNGKFFTVGDHGAEFTKVRKGDIIFNHKQTEELFKNGYVTSDGGRAKLVGGAFYHGTAYATGGRLPVPGTNGYGYGTSSGGSSSSKKQSSSSSSSTAKAANNAAKAASSAAKSTEEAAKEFKEKFDEIEILLDRMDKSLNNLTDSIKTYSYDISKQSEVSDQAMNQIRSNLGTLQQAYNRYIQEANSVGLEEAWAQKVRDGSINIETITDEDLNDRISEYQKWYDKAIDVQDTIADYQKQLLDLAVEKLENIDQYFSNRTEYNDNYGYLTSITTLQEALNKLNAELDKQVRDGIIIEGSDEWYDAQNTIADRLQELLEATFKKYQDIIDNLTRISDTLDNSIALKEARDEPITEEDYQKQMDINNQSIQEMFDKRQALLKQQSIYDVGSELYDDYADQIADLDDDIYGLLTDIEELKDKIWEVRWQPFFDGQEALEDLIDETDDFRKLLNDDAFIGAQGGLTSEGITNLSLISQSMNAAKQQIRNYQEALVKLNEDLQNGNISTSEYEDQQKDFLDQIRDSVGVVEDYRDEITDLWREMIQKENDVIQDSIDKHKELLDVKKENDEYSRNVKDQTKDINQLQAQISALSGVNNESAKAELKNLQAQLAEAQDKLSQTQKDREYDIRQQGYDYLSDDLNNALQDTLDEVTYNANKQEQVISEMLNHVVTNYQTAYDKINQIIANTGFTPSNDFQQNIDNLGSAAGSQNQVNASQTIAPNYTPDNFVTGTNTGHIQSGTSVDTNNKIEGEISKEPNINNRPVALIELKPSSISVEEGKTASITANIRPTDAKNKTLSWSSSNTSVATVSNGSVKGVKPGSATITCTATDGSGTVATASVTVTKKPDPPAPAPSTGGGDGVPRVGDVVTFTGSYYYDSWGQRPAGNLYAGVPGGVVIDAYSGSEYGGSSRFHGGYGVHIKSADGRYGDLGWVSLGQLSGYAQGSSRIGRDQLAWTQEKGAEIIVSPSTGAMLTPLKMGDGVIPHNLTKNLMRWGELNPDQVMPGLADSIMPMNVDNRNITIENKYDSLLTVNGDVDKDALPKLQQLLEQAYQYTSKKMYKDARLQGIRKTL